MNRTDATPTSAPDRGRQLGARRTADAEGHRFTWHPAPQAEQKLLRAADEKVPTDVGMRI